MKAYGLNESGRSPNRHEYMDMGDIAYTGAPSRFNSKAHGQRTSRAKKTVRRNIRKAGRRAGKDVCKDTDY